MLCKKAFPIIRCLIFVLFLNIVFSQVLRWSYTWNPGPGVDRAIAIVQGYDSNIYAAGYIKYDPSEEYDIGVISLTTNGDTNWTYRYAGTEHLDDQANDIVYGSDGNIYLTGDTYSDTTSWDIIVICITGSGVERWIYQYNGPGNSTDHSYAIDMDSAGNIYVAAGILGFNFDFTVISIDANGGQRWVYRYDGPGAGVDCAYDVRYGVDGNIYAAGYSEQSGCDFTVISLTPSGTERWVYRYGGGPGGYDEAYKITFDADSNIYVCGKSVHPFDDFTVVSLSPSGSERWKYTFNQQSCANSITYGDDGNIYAAGWNIPGYGRDYLTISLTPAGTERWFYTHSFSVGDDVASVILLGNDGNVYVGGNAVVSLSTGGTEIWSYDDASWDMVYGFDGYLYIAGAGFRIYSLDPLTGIGEKEISRNVLTDLETTPNPFSSNTVIKYALPTNTQVKLNIYDVNGRAVKSLVKSEVKVGYHNVHWDGLDNLGKKVPSGVYFLKFETEDYTETKQLLLIK